jgi:sugar phosphate isomerase/epimerase
MIGMSSTWMATRGMDIRESIERCFGLGFELVEVGAGHRYEPNAVETVIELKRKYPDKRFTVHALFPPMEKGSYVMNMSDSKEHTTILKTADGMFDLAKSIGADVVGLHGGHAGEVVWVPDRGGFDKLEVIKSIPAETAENSMMALLEKLVRLAEERGVKLAIEISPFDISKPVLSDPDIFERVFSKFKSENLGLLLDIGHVHISAAAKGFDPYDFTERLKGKIFEVHLHDVVDGEDHHLVGTGEIDFGRHFEIIGKRTLEEIPLVFEYTNLVSEEDALRGKKRIEEILEAL